MADTRRAEWLFGFDQASVALKLFTGLFFTLFVYKYFVVMCEAIKRVCVSVRFRSSSSSKVLVFTDVGDEIDDEVGLYELFFQSSDPLDIKLVITTGRTQLRVNAFWYMFKEFFLDGRLVQSSPSSFNVIRNGKPFHRVSLFVGSDTQRKINKVVRSASPLAARHVSLLTAECYEVLVIMAPLDGISTQLFTELSVNNVVVVGNLKSTNTCATTALEAFLPRWRAIRKATKGKIILLDPSLAQQIPFTKKYLTKLPVSFANCITQLSFEFLVRRPARLSPQLQKSINAANAKTAKSYWNDVTGAAFPDVIGEPFMCQAQKYCNEYCPEDKETVNNVATILMVVFRLTGQVHTSEELVDLPDMESAYACFLEACIRIKAFTPAYDLVGIKLALSLIEGRSDFLRLMNPQIQTAKDKETDLLEIAVNNCYLCKNVSQHCVQKLIDLL